MMLDSLAMLQMAEHEVARVPTWLAHLHCPNLCLSCHFFAPAGYLMFCHGSALPEALTASVLSDFEKWSDEADFNGHEGTFYTCNLTRQLNRQVGDLEQRVVSMEVQSLPMSRSAAAAPSCSFPPSLDIVATDCRQSSERKLFWSCWKQSSMKCSRLYRGWPSWM